MTPELIKRIINTLTKMLAENDYRNSLTGIVCTDSDDVIEARAVLTELEDMV